MDPAKALDSPYKNINMEKYKSRTRQVAALSSELCEDILFYF